jgi:hypothetical protein
MPAGTIGTIMNFGYSGELAYGPDNFTSARAVNASSATINFGEPVVLNTDNSVSSVNTVTLSTTNFLGIARRVVQQATSYTSPNGNGGFPASTMADVIERGEVTVPVVHGTPTAGGAVYVRKTANGSFPAENVGDYRADADGSNTILLPNASWATGKVDGKNMAVIKLKTFNN